MRYSLGLLAAVLLVALAACGDESDDSTEVAGSTSDVAAEADPTGGSGAYTEEAEEEVPEGQLPDDQRSYEEHVELTEADAIATIERYFYGPYDRETCELLTDRFLRQSYGNMDGCVLGAGELATRITIAPGKVTATAATGFEVDAEGSVYSGEKVTVDLIAGPDSWLISDLSVDAPVGP